VQCLGSLVQLLSEGVFCRFPRCHTGHQGQNLELKAIQIHQGCRTEERAHPEAKELNKIALSALIQHTKGAKGLQAQQQLLRPIEAEVFRVQGLH